jgi:hypothetical protein
VAQTTEHGHANQTLLKGLEELFILATKYSTELTMAQMAGKAKIAMKKCGLFQTYLNE